MSDFREEREKEWINHGNAHDQKTGGRNKKKGSEYLAGMNLTIFQLSLEQLREGWGEVWKQSANNEESERNGG